MISAKYPRTSHFYSSPNSRDPDHRLNKTIEDLGNFIGQEIVFTEKCDGGNCCLTNMSVFARTHAMPTFHPQFNWVKAKHAVIKNDIDENVSLFGEMLYAVHSIRYTHLPDHFMMFAVRDDVTNMWYAWDQVKQLSERLGLIVVPELFRGTVSSIDELCELIKLHAEQPSLYGPEREGVVVRTTCGFKDEEFRTHVTKYVRANHVQTDEHWSAKPIERQGLRTC